MEFIRKAAKNGTNPDISWIWDETAEWPLDYVWESVSTFYPSPAEDKPKEFEHALGKNGRPTSYSKWYLKWAIQKWEEGMKVDLVWDEEIFTKYGGMRGGGWRGGGRRGRRMLGLWVRDFEG